MKKILAMSIALVLLLSSCAEIATNTKQGESTQQANTSVEPGQGGLILYTYTGKNGKVGIINQNGKIIAQPQFDKGFYDFFRDQSGTHIMGIVLRKGQEQHIYYNDGRHVICKEKCHELNVMDGGRYVYINPWTSYSTGDLGVYDLQTESYLIRPKKGQQVAWSHGKLIYKRNRQIWLYDPNDQSTRKVPGLSEYNGSFYYLPKVGWYVFYGEKVYDSKLKEITALRGYSISGDYDNNVFSAGDYAMIELRNTIDNHNTITIAFVNRKGEISHKGQYLGSYSYQNSNSENVTCSSQMLDQFFQVIEKDGTTVWLDQNLKELGRAKEGEILEYNGTPHNILLDKDGNVIRAIDENFKTRTENEVYSCYGDYDGSEKLYRLKDGEWKTLDLQQYLVVEYQKATAPVVCDEYVIVCIEQHKKWEQPVATNMQYSPRATPVLSILPPLEVVAVFALDWNGKVLNKCPLSPYFQGVVFEGPEYVFPNAGLQGRTYYWAESKNKRGYLNAKGEWLFVEP